MAAPTKVIGRTPVPSPLPKRDNPPPVDVTRPPART
jgi:hypothetical protein